MVVTPLDQGTRVGGKVVSKPALSVLVDAERRVAEEQGCAFWNAFEAMGGQGSMARWVNARPALAWTDLAHISATGQAIIGNLLADAIEAGYEDWLRGGNGVAVVETAVPDEMAALSR
jgi:hypothetical protein